MIKISLSYVVQSLYICIFSLSEWVWHELNEMLQVTAQNFMRGHNELHYNFKSLRNKLGLNYQRSEHRNDEFCFRNFVMQYDAELSKGCKNDLMQACIAT